ncbi:MAG TPA: class I SAM-dependent methyltransferase [Pseudogracilibacillus sp.]|nr:class I SAM-dependent methyltransferase [Pseudogracilibacillus sp.]
MTSYENFALVYDRLMKNAPYDEWLQFTNHFIKNKQINSVVDLGCGTGEITLRLAEQNRQLFGVDLSADMLSIAEQKAIDLAKQVNWIKQDIRELEGFTNIDLCVSYCDVINYITAEEDLDRVFHHVYESLSDQGIFIFDVHSMEHVNKNLTNQTFTYTAEDVAYIWDCEPGECDGEMYHEMTFFYKNSTKSNTYTRIEESHYQRTFPVETYVDLLTQANFSHIELYGDFSIENEFSEQDSERIFIIARKK